MRCDARQLVGSIVLCVLLTAAQASNSQAQPGPPADPPCSGTIDAHAVDVHTHEPIAGAIVKVNGEAVGLTDGAGHFLLTKRCPGELQIEVEREDYEPGVRAFQVAARRVSLELELRPRGEVIVILDEAPAPEDMQSTAVLAGEALERTRGRGFAEAFSDIPGVTQLGSSSGMAKPIVRGQFGRRLLLLVDGVRHRAQEWGLDHAPEIDPFVADKLTVVRGAAGVRYGSDAIGGAILVDPPERLRKPGVAGEVHLIGISNGRGGSLASRVQAAPASVPGLAWQVEGSAKRLAAAETPEYPLDNTGVEEWNVGATAGYRTRDADYALSYRHYQARLGVCSCLRIESSEDFFAQLERERPAGVELYDTAFEIERPYQSVAHDLALARGRWWPASVGAFTATYALQYDRRREYDIVRNATAGPQYDFRLTTHDLDLAFEHNPVHLTDHLHLRGTVGVVGMAQVHAYSGLPLIPDHQAWGTGVHLSERLLGHEFELEAGVRYDLLRRTASIVRRDFLRLVRSDQLAANACGTADADPVECESTFHTFSASVGALRQLTPAWSAKFDLSTASRAPNTDEQYLNGTAPTFPVLGLGKPDLGPETTYSASTTTTYQGQRLAAEASAYANFISDYIDFAPAINENGEPIFDVLISGAFPRFVTRPVDAVFYGFDGGILAKPVPWLELGGQLSVVRARNVSDDAYLVFVPPERLRGSATYTRTDFWGLRKGFASVAGTYVARQDRFDLAADFAPPPEAHFLLEAELGIETRVGDQTLKVALHGTNLLDARYRDYTSLLRYFVDQPGRQLMLRLSMHFSSFE